MQLEIHKLTNNNLGTLQKDWDSLHSRVCPNNPYLSSHFVERLLSYYGTGDEYACVLRDGTRLTAIGVVVRANALKWELFRPAQTQLGPLISEDVSLLHEIVCQLPRPCVALDVLNQDPDILDISDATVRLPIIAQDHALTTSITGAQSFDAYWAERPRKLRQNINRRLRKAQSLSIHYQRLDEPDQLHSAVARYGNLESRGWKGAVGTAVSPDNAQGRFYADLMMSFAKEGLGSVHELYFGDSLVASRMCIASGNTLVMLKTTYDESYAKLSPGRLLLYSVLREELSAHRYDKIEFYTDANKDLIDWATHTRNIRHYLVIRNGFLRYLYNLKQVATR